MPDNDIYSRLIDDTSEAVSLRVRASLMREIGKVVKNWEIPQVEAAKRLGISQPRLSDLLKGKIEKFSLDALVKLVDPAGLELSVRVKPIFR